MSLVSSLYLISTGWRPSAPAWIAALAFSGSLAAIAQNDISTVVSPPPQTEATSPASAVVTTPLVAAGPRWSELSLSQQEALMPLHGTWSSLNITRKRKWIAVAENYSALPAAEQSKFHSRMAEWAALSPAERELARFNFVATKKIGSSERASTWEAYKALSPEERQRLAAAGPIKPAGTATAVKPARAGKLTEVPITRHTPASVRELVFSKQAIDRNTLLPLPIKPQTEPSTR
jgi:hypothetical protein